MVRLYCFGKTTIVSIKGKDYAFWDELEDEKGNKIIVAANTKGEAWEVLEKGYEGYERIGEYEPTTLKEIPAESFKIWYEVFYDEEHSEIVKGG